MTTAATQRDPASPYTFSNDTPTSGQLLTALGEMFDEFSRRRLRVAGVREGARVLEVGAGAGTIAMWAAEQVGPAGEVVATDIKPQHIPDHNRLTVLRHNIVTDGLPGTFDVIHARAVLQHLPQRHAVLAKLVDALTPGGALVIEEMVADWAALLLDTPDERAPGVLARYQQAMQATLTANGTDIRWARQAHAAMRRLGLDVDTEGWERSFPGGTGSCLLAHAGSAELRGRLIDAGMPADDLDVLATLTLDPRLVMRGILLLSTTGRTGQVRA